MIFYTYRVHQPDRKNNRYVLVNRHTAFTYLGTREYSHQIVVFHFPFLLSSLRYINLIDFRCDTYAQEYHLLFQKLAIQILVLYCKYGQ